MEFVNIKDKPPICRFEDLDIGEYFVWIRNKHPWEDDHLDSLCLKVSDVCYFNIEQKALYSVADDCEEIDGTVYAWFDIGNANYSYNVAGNVNRVSIKADTIGWEILK